MGGGGRKENIIIIINYYHYYYERGFHCKYLCKVIFFSSKSYNVTCHFHETNSTIENESTAVVNILFRGK